jgi:hypothetical protein
MTAHEQLGNAFRPVFFRQLSLQHRQIRLDSGQTVRHGQPI